MVLNRYGATRLTRCGLMSLWQDRSRIQVRREYITTSYMLLRFNIMFARIIYYNTITLPNDIRQI